MKKQNKKVFIVDDDPAYREILKHELSALNKVEIVAFESAEDCVARIKEGPDLVVLDFNLDSASAGAMSGKEAVDNILKIDPEMNILIVSSSMSKELAKVCLSSFSISYLSKASHNNNDLRDRVSIQLFGDVISPEIAD